MEALHGIVEFLINIDGRQGHQVARIMRRSLIGSLCVYCETETRTEITLDLNGGTVGTACCSNRICASSALVKELENRNAEL